MATLMRNFDGTRLAALAPGSLDCLHLLIGDWQVLSDLSQSDLLLWVPDRTRGFVCIAHCRPASGPTVHVEDVVGLALPQARRELMQKVMDSGEIRVNPVRRWTGLNTVVETLIPVKHEGQTIAVVARESNLAFAQGEVGGRAWQQEATDILFRMLAHGELPYQANPTGGKRGIPRVTDGVLLLDTDGRVLQASPNAVSAFKRLGIAQSLVGCVLAEELTALVEPHTQVDEALAVVVMGRASWLTEISSRGVVLTMRALPLTDEGRRVGAIILCRDVTERRSHELELMSKDATIREIHHRVKNNLQTVSALLRLQARRSGSDEVKKALGEAERRVSTIAMVHEALSQRVDESVGFDEMFERVLRLAATAASPGHHVHTEFHGTFGRLSADPAAALGVVLTELVTNAVEHGLEGRDGTVVVRAERQDDVLITTVSDDGYGIEEGKAASGLGTQIVNTLVRNELGGTIEWSRRTAPDSGTVVTLRATKL